MTKYSFPPLIDHSSKILILGSLPGEESLKQVQYYAHPRNAFWKIMFTIFNEVYNEDYSIRCKLLLKNHIALWDMVHSGYREGSLDSDIKNEVPNDIDGLLKEYQAISKILLNGKKAEAM
ncbi:MAG: DNA-deoxyinosine glycosylase, partial [Peptoanaerobacter stomatis]